MENRSEFLLDFLSHLITIVEKLSDVADCLFVLIHISSVLCAFGCGGNLCNCSEGVWIVLRSTVMLLLLSAAKFGLRGGTAPASESCARIMAAPLGVARRRAVPPIMAAIPVFRVVRIFWRRISLVRWIGVGWFGARRSMPSAPFITMIGVRHLPKLLVYQGGDHWCQVGHINKASAFSGHGPWAAILALTPVWTAFRWRQGISGAAAPRCRFSSLCFGFWARLFMATTRGTCWRFWCVSPRATRARASLPAGIFTGPAAQLLRAFFRARSAPRSIFLSCRWHPPKL